jgi:hypothetical protein
MERGIGWARLLMILGADGWQGGKGGEVREVCLLPFRLSYPVGPCRGCYSPTTTLPYHVVTGERLGNGTANSFRFLEFRGIGILNAWRNEHEG